MSNHIHVRPVSFDGIKAEYVPAHRQGAFPAAVVIGPDGKAYSAEYMSLSVEDARTLRDQLNQIFKEIDG